MTKIIIYQTPDNQTAVEVKMDKETVWLSLNQMSQLFQRDKSVVSRRLKNSFEEGELPKDSVVAFFATTAANGKICQVLQNQRKKQAPTQHSFPLPNL